MRFVSVDKTTNTASIAVKGDATIIEGVQVKDEADDAYAMGCSKFVVDFKDTEFMDSAFIQALVYIFQKVGGDNFFYKNASGPVMDILEGASLTQYWHLAS